MTILSEFFINKSLTKTCISRNSVIITSRLSRFSGKESVKLTAEEHLNALVIDVKPTKILTELYGHLKLKC